MSSESKPSGVVFGSCNKNFLRYRKFRYWDSKVNIFSIFHYGFKIINSKATAKSFTVAHAYRILF